MNDIIKIRQKISELLKDTDYEGIIYKKGMLLSELINKDYKKE